MTLLVVIIVLSLIFDFSNGFHDAANSIATIVSTKVLTPFQAVLWAAFFNFIAYFIFTDHHVASTVAKVVHPDYINDRVVLAGILAAITWNLLTWWYGIPSSSSHTLIGGFAGAGLTAAGLQLQSVDLAKIGEIAAFIVLAPIVGMVVAMFITFTTSLYRFWQKAAIIVLATAVTYVFVPLDDVLKWGLIGFSTLFLVAYAWDRSRPPSALRTANLYKRLQLLSSAAFSIGHGGNDAQKTMGLITAALVSNHIIGDLSEMPDWVPLACYAAMGLGTMSGGWRIVKTMGTRITKVTPLEGVCAETAGAMTLYVTEHLGIPVSTTHTITGSIMGVGATKRLSAVRWGVTIQLVWAWIITIPVSALMAAVFWALLGLVGM
ncbi:MAG: inorganic phosphate transporter [Flavobacteriales bacterium]|nr:inorganic phosphate transporter [Flavobacteriales bacterium]MCB9194198.1 inorganic phosphate transporter [Flavobacteriales bacterium]